MKAKSQNLVNFRATDRFTVEEALLLMEVTNYASVLLERDQGKKGGSDYSKEDAERMFGICKKLDRICARETKRLHKEATK